MGSGSVNATRYVSIALLRVLDPEVKERGQLLDNLVIWDVSLGPGGSTVRVEYLYMYLHSVPLHSRRAVRCSQLGLCHDGGQCFFF